MTEDPEEGWLQGLPMMVALVQRGGCLAFLLTESFHVDFCFLPELQFRVVVRDTGGSRAHLLLAQARWPRPRFIVW